MSLPLSETTTVYLKPYTAKELAAMYGVERRTFNKWLEPFGNEIGERKGRYFTVVQVKIIFTRLGLPGVATET